MPGALDEIEAIGAHGGGMTGVPTGFADLDALTNGLHAGQMIVIAARPAVGKALALDTPLPTPTGWTTMGQVAVGDQLLGADGRPTRVVAATEVMHGRPCYEVEFSDGEVIVADAQHQWLTWDRRRRRSCGAAAGGHHAAKWPPRCGLSGRRRSRVATAVPRRCSSCLRLTCWSPPYPLGASLAGRTVRRASRARARGPESACGRRPPDSHDPAAASGGRGAHPDDLSARQRAQRRALLAGHPRTAGAVAGTGAVQLAARTAELAADVTGAGPQPRLRADVRR